VLQQAHMHNIVITGRIAHSVTADTWVCGPRTVLSLAVIWNTIVSTPVPAYGLRNFNDFLQFIGFTMQPESAYFGRFAFR